MKQCLICGKTSMVIVTLKKLRGKYNPTSKKRKYPNLQWTKVQGKRVKACTECIKAQNKTR